MKHVMNYVMKYVLFCVVVVLAVRLEAQPLVNPYPFAMGDSLDVDTSLLYGSVERAGERGQIVSRDGHLWYPDSTRFRIVGTTMRLTGCFPDSAAAVRIARRLRALGINTVQFMQFDYTYWRGYSVLADGPTSTGGGLDSINIARFDWFLHQLREQGIYYGFYFHSIWRPRAGDGVRQPDSTGWGTRTPIFFDPVVQRIHRDIMRLVLDHVNPHTGLAYKDDPALLYVGPVEESSLSVYWAYTKDVVATNPSGTRVVGLEHLALMDSLYHDFLRGKGYTTTAALSQAWRLRAADPSEQIRNGGFEDPFDQTNWTLVANASLDAQAILQYSETEKVSGEFGGRIRIGRPSNNGAVGGIYVYQALEKATRGHGYRLSMWLKTTPEQGTRRFRVDIRNNGYPYDNYGLTQTVEITSEWKKYDFDFIAKSTDEGSVIMIAYMGMDPGDVFIDDVTFTEINVPGVRAGESMENRTIQRLAFSDPFVSPQRAADQAEFYLASQEALLEADRRFLRDTVGTATLLTPGRRVYDVRDRYAARNYDFFSYYEFRSSALSFLQETGGSSSWVHSAQNMEDKPYVLSGLGYQYPRPYLPEVGVVMPAYAGLHDWDGIHFSYFAAAPRAGNWRVDSLNYWDMYDKPHVLTMLPLASNMLRRFDVQPSEKSLVISNSRQSLSNPLFHSTQAYSLSLGADGRMGLFRRIVMDSELQDEESYLPQLDISPLANTVDLTALDAENGQIYFDATKALMRVVTPHTMAVAGKLAGEIVSERDLVVEQTSAGDFTTVVVQSLTDSAIVMSARNLCVIGARGLNEGAEFAADNATLERWGQGGMMLEGRSIRLTLRAPGWDSCHVTPLGPDARPLIEKRRSSTPSVTGRFALSFETNVDQTPWYVIEFSAIPTSVDEDRSTARCTVQPNPVGDEDFIVRHHPGARRITVLDAMGGVVREVETTSDATTVSTVGLAAGSYTLMIDEGQRGSTRVVVLP